MTPANASACESLGSSDKRRSVLTEQQREQIRERNQVTRQARAQRGIDDERASQRIRSLARKRSNRANESPEQHDSRLRASREIMRASRLRETSERAQCRRERNRNSMRATRSQELRTANQTSRNSQIVRRRIIADAGSVGRVDVGAMDIECRNCGALHFLAERKVGSSVSNPLFSNCCQGGKITSAHIPLLRDPPQLLGDMLTLHTPQATAFRKNIVSYNNALCMASINANWINRGEGSSSFNPTVTVQGRIHHYIGGLQPAPGRNPAFLAIYIFDTDFEAQAEIRSRHVSRVQQGLIRSLASMLHQHNTYVQTFLSLREWIRAERPSTEYRIVIHADKRPSNEHVRRYNGPSCSEVAAQIPGNEDGMVGNRDIVVRRRGALNSNGNEALDKIKITHRSYDPLSYVILFPDGRDGWHLDMRFDDGSKERKLTPMMFYRWHMFQRRAEFSTVLHGGRLFQYFLVDQFCKMEADRLSYLARNQQKLRAENYTSLREQLGDTGGHSDESEAVRSGRLVVLPSTYVGGERYMRQKMHDIIATSNRLGHPDIFLTMTCNPNWPEIRQSLLPGQSPKDRPDLCARVFSLKLKSLMETVIKDDIFGKVVAHVRVIEFQKRGLPHAHCIFILDQTSKNALRNPAAVDRIISAELPPEEDDELRRIILQHMVHNPCGSHNPAAVCMGDRGCKKKFPKPFRPETQQSESENYISYRRRSPEEGGEAATRPVRGNQDQQVDNSWVVPYNAKLMRMFHCHINVELCVSRVGGIKYLFKYICKGSDRITMQIVNEGGVYNEINMFQDARYVSASEAAWRILGFDIVDNKPPVVRLEVHVHGHHTVYFQEGGEMAASLRDPGTKLTEWFKANIKYPGANHLRYDEYPRFFTWNRSEKVWKPRAKFRRRGSRGAAASSAGSAGGSEYIFEGSGESVIGRLYTVSPREGERYYLRMLLLHVTGAKSFAEVRTVDSEECASFREACSRRGLLTDDAEWRRALREAFASQFVPLSHVFATILAYCEPSDPLSLWNEHKSIFLSDIRARHRGLITALQDDEIALSYALLEVQESLQLMGNFNLTSFQLPNPQEDLPPLILDTEEALPEPDRLQAAVREAVPSLNAGQKAVFDAVVGCVLPGVSSSNLEAPVNINGSRNNLESRVFFLDAPGGTGKTFVTRAIHDFLRLREKNVIAVATSAVAAVLLDEGRTAHSTFKIPIPCTAESTCCVSAGSQLARDLRDVDFIIWDEVVMCHRYCIEAVDRSLRDITMCRSPFGGKCVLFSGDFRQILPVIQGGSRAQIVHACVKSSALYAQFRVLRLTENMRLASLRNDPLASPIALQFPNYLLRLGEGRLSATEGDLVDLPESVEKVFSIDDLCNTVFDGIESNYSDFRWLTSRAILTTKNSKLKEINEKVGSRIPGGYKTFLSADTVDDEDQNALKYPVEVLNSLTAGAALPDHQIQLKKGFMVMLLRNMCPRKGHVNGARYIVEHITNNLLHLRVAVGSHAGSRLTLPRVPCGPGDDNFPVPGFKRTQFPVRVCFGMTINKAQGQSFGGKLGLDLSDGCFAHGQLYVGESRVTDPRNLTVSVTRADNKTRNVVYPEALSQSSQ